ncbi:MAG TPA: 4Fe-4S binding protein [Acidobacteriota bacterium]|nr:4Fe-4S binding protein [Acidobacteriota bacterium]
MRRRIRLASQILFFIIFLVLLVQTEYKGEDTLGEPERVFPVGVFSETDLLFTPNQFMILYRGDTVRVFLEIDPLLTLAATIAAQGFFFFAIGFGVALALVVWGGKLAAGMLARLGAGDSLILAAGRYVPLTVAIAMMAWAVFPFGVDRGLPIPMTLGIATVLVTLTLGRVFCGWFCPMGTLHQFVAWLRRDKLKARIFKNQYMPSQRWKYMFLLGLLAAALLGFQITGVADPISLVIRSFSVVVSPVVNQIFNGAYDLTYATGNDAVKDFADQLYSVVAYPNLLSFHEPHFMGAVLIGGVFVILLALNLRRPRWWCRNLCPLGALLGSISRNSFYHLEIDKETCIHCGRCHSGCQGACDPEFKEGWRPAECFVCFHCVDECPVNCLSFRFGPVPAETNEYKGIDLKKRRALGAVAAALLAVPLLKASEQYKTDATQGAAEKALFNPSLIRPPGSIPEEEFLQRCVRCGECMKVCLTNALHPATFEAGVEGLWTPVLVPRIGYCEYYCTLCGQVCPTGAIRHLDVRTKINTVIGTAFFDTNRCLPFAFGKTCIVCEEHCPTSPKAIYLVPADRITRDDAVSTADPYGFGGDRWASPTEEAEAPETQDGELQSGQISPFENDQDTQPGQISPFGDDSEFDQGETVMQPRIDLDLCIGCGICEKVCVLVDKPGVYITSIGETRNPANRITLEGTFGESQQ